MEAEPEEEVEQERPRTRLIEGKRIKGKHLLPEFQEVLRKHGFQIE
jgi:hypothetical protein